jgi:hypothetical protein
VASTIEIEAIALLLELVEMSIIMTITTDSKKDKIELLYKKEKVKTEIERSIKTTINNIPISKILFIGLFI